MEKPVTRFCTLGGMCRFFSCWTMIYFCPAFFALKYPQYVSQYSSINALSLGIFGFTSAIIGGFFSARGHPSKVCQACAALAIPMSILLFITSGNFWFAILCLALKYLLGEAWGPPTMTMMQNVTPSENQGFMVSAYLLHTTFAGTMATAICGLLSFVFNAGQNASVLGRIICGLEVISMAMSIYFFRKAGQYYPKQTEN